VAAQRLLHKAADRRVPALVPRVLVLLFPQKEAVQPPLADHPLVAPVARREVHHLLRALPAPVQLLVPAPHLPASLRPLPNQSS
jgi:hypothetical protein